MCLWPHFLFLLQVVTHAFSTKSPVSYFDLLCAQSTSDDMIIFSENWHDPVRCHLIKKWIKKCDDDRCVTFERGPN